MSEKKKLLLIINPKAGKSGYRSGFADVMLTLSNGGYDTTVRFTEGRGDATRFAAQHAKEFDTIACIGGDGTLSEVIAGLMTLTDPPDVGYFPMGTTNDIATTLGLPKNDTLSAARCLIQGTPHPFDVGGFGKDAYFAYIAAFGAFTEVSYTTPQDQKKALGHLAYVLQGMALLPKLESIPTVVEYDGGRFEGRVLYGSMSNSSSVAGMIKFTDSMVQLGDGLSELVLVKDPGNMEGVGDILSAVLTQTYEESENLLIVHTKKASFHFEKPVAWTRDGEAGGEFTDVELCNYNAPVRIIF